ncbi:hypothetical protein ID866_5062 [Astraeus odoratus]|nr:hypothetical protein ID866_5062 [Astraeus odoratus]
MSLYTPVFPSIREQQNHACEDPHDPTPSSHKSQNYVDLLRDVHLFLSSQDELLSPPSRPSSPNFADRVSRLREGVRDALEGARGEPANGMWSHLSAQLKMGCVRGRHWAVSNHHQGAIEADTEWVLPDTEQEWFDLEKKREVRRSKKQVVSLQRAHTAPSLQPSPSGQLDHVDPFPSRHRQEEQVSAVSPATMLQAKAKVKKWQATIVSDFTPHADLSQRSSKPSTDGMLAKGKALSLEKNSSSLNFPVVKRAAGTGDGNKGKAPLGGGSRHRGAVGDSGTISNIRHTTTADGQGEPSSGGATGLSSTDASRKALLTIGARQRINYLPETLDSSTPQPRREEAFLSKPSSIIPLPSSSTPPPSTPSGRDCIHEKPRATNVSTPQAPQLDAPQLSKRTQSFPLDTSIIELSVTPAKEHANRLTQPLRATPPVEDAVRGVPALDTIDILSCSRDENGPAASGDAVLHADSGDDGIIETSVFMDPVQALADDVVELPAAEHHPSPVKSSFSSCASSPPMSPVPNQNLLLHSPGSPVFSFAHSTDGFRPLYTSTQTRPKPLGPASSGIFAMGYNSQFDVEKHVDRVNTQTTPTAGSLWTATVASAASAATATHPSTTPLTMSRRDSKVSLNTRQNDALTEFENFKKKFLLANKHITKLNSTLSVRIEELQAQISTLYVENLRLRASEIALAAQLKKEQEKSRKILADAEAATSNLSKHLGLLRQSFVVSAGPSPRLETKSVPRARRPVVDPNTSPMVPRLSRAPNIPGINEDEEASEEEVKDQIVFSAPLASHRFTRDRDRGEPSTLPVPARVASPPPLSMPLHVNLVDKEATLKRKGRRQSGLLSVNTNVGISTESERGEGLIPPRAASPAFGSPVRRQAGLAEDDEERRVENMLDPGSALIDDNDYVMRPRKEKKEKKSKHTERDHTPEDTDGTSSSKAKERKRRREEELSGLKDVTNSPRSRSGLPPLDTNTSDIDRQRTPDNEGITPTSAATSVATSRTFLSTPMTTPATTPPVSHLPSPRTSSPIPSPTGPISEVDGLMNGRERRSRKSVNYAEPKLNTKMRKPDPVPPVPVTSAPKKRISTSLRGDEAEPRLSSDGLPQAKAPPSKHPSSSSSSTSNSASIKRKKSRPYIPADDDDESDGVQADAEYACSSIDWVNVDSRRRSAQSNGTINSTRGVNLRRSPEVDDARRHSLAV